MACMGFLAVSQEHDGVWSGQVSVALRQFYDLKQAEMINSSEINLLSNETIVFSDSTQENMYMSEHLDLMVSPEVLAKTLNLSVKAADDGKYHVSDGKKTYIFEINNDKVISDEESFGFDGCIQQNNNGIFVALEAVCLAFEHGYRFNLDDHSGMIIRTDSAAAVPPSYDMRNDARAPVVGSQGNLGTCWAFASVAAMESVFLPEERVQFSVDHMSLNNGFHTSQDAGGDYYIAMSYLASWKGPVWAADDPYGDGVSDSSLLAVKHLQEAAIIRSKDYEMIKRMIYEYGAVQSSFYSDIEYSNVGSDYYNISTAAYYYPGDETANHDIVIVGWDDHYSKDNFNFKPENDGAFLCQNSWGNTFGQNGYFYISYEDTNIGVYNMVYTVLEEPDNYENMYQSDDLGWLGNIGYNEPSAWFANVYTVPNAQRLEAVSFYATDANSYYEVYIVPEYISEDSLNEKVFAGSGYVENGGYYTVPLENEIDVTGPFAVMIYIETEDAVHPIAIEYEGGELDVDVDISDGQGYISYNGKNWQSAEDNYNCNVCLKVFTNNR